MKKIRKIVDNLFRDELGIQHKLLNLILSVAFAGGIISLGLTAILGIKVENVFTILLLIVTVGFALWLANRKNNPRVAALITVGVANMVLFPIMYITGGGISSGMPAWFILGLIFSWLILSGKLCIIVYLINVAMVVACILVEMIWPEFITPLPNENVVYFDIIQSVIVVTVIFGAIFKYQTYVYEKQRKQILRANETKNDFLANMSHEVRTPINAILGYNEMIIQESRESHTISHATNIQTAGRTLLTLVDNIFEFTSIEQDELYIKEEEYYVSELIQDVVTFVEYFAESKGLEIRLEVDDRIPQRLFGDPMRIKQVLDNLVSNAMKYTKEGYVEIILAWEPLMAKKGNLAVSVRDTGIGMRQEDLFRISDSFLRFDNKNTRDIQGVGLGLTIVTRLLHMMESRLEVESELGKGSVFYFKIPQSIVDNTGIGKWDKTILNKETSASQAFVAPTARILAVDDNIMNLDILKRMLKSTEMQINTATNGMEAYELVRKNQYNLILMDHMMPIMDGVEALNKMKEEKLCENTPIIVLTANAIGDARQEYIDKGFDDYLSKPIMSTDLLAMIKKHLPQEIVSDTYSVPDDITETKEDNPFYFLNTEIGMTYCCDDEEFYREVLNTYLDTNKYQEINESYEKQDWENYRILVHALKSTSNSIGATELSEAAKALEMAAKEDRIDYIKANHEDVMKQYEELLGLLKKAFCKDEVKVDVATDDVVDEKQTILVVDDDKMNLKIAEKLLGAAYKVNCAKSGNEAFDILAKEIPHLILLDLHMPEMDGLEVIRKIKQMDAIKDIPVIFLTADNDTESELKCLKEGAVDFITKPFLADIMLQRIKRVLDLERLQNDLQSEVHKQTKKAEERSEKVERLSLQVMMTLANTIDAKDKYTNGHSERVAQYAREIAKRLGKNEQEQNNIYYTGLLHDIGKIGIPDTIINKRSSLTDEEYAIIKTHPQKGADILKNMTELPELVIAAHWHHERYDGKGYPDGLKGNEIPEMARIIGVADAYDAMTSKRSYRDALPQEVVKQEIVKGKGTQFDPKFAEIMIKMIEEDTEYLMRE
ncbi:MAG: response regulator [Lachnospiraceae bacterium]|nr:response regulator [Lachnospiraceae bacterium]